MLQFRRSGLTAGIAALFLNTACYSYHVVPYRAAATAAPVRVPLTAAGTADLARFLGPRVTLVEGTLASVQPDGSLVIGVEWLEIDDVLREPWTGEGQVTFPAGSYRDVQQLQFNRQKTVLISAIVVGLAVAIGVIALKSGGASLSGNGTTPPPPASH